MTQNDMNMTFYVKNMQPVDLQIHPEPRVLVQLLHFAARHGVLRRNVSELLKFGFFLKQLILMRLARPSPAVLVHQPA